MDIHLNNGTVALLAQEVLNEYGEDFMYASCPINGCSYVHLNTTENASKKEAGCFVGQILVRAGVSLEWLDEMSTFNPFFRNIARQDGLTFTDRAYDSLAMAQFFQDAGVGVAGDRRFTWGEAWDHARQLSIRINRYEADTEDRIS